MVDIWFISDTHFGHENIIKYCDRPFKDAYHMNEVLIANWNAVVRPQDHVYHLGDVASSQQTLNYVLPRLNGHKRLVLGNHDNHAPMRNYCQYFDKILLWRKFDDIIFTHVPLPRENFPGKSRANAHGHIHEKPSPPGPYMNLCVEWTGYAPVHFDDVQKMARKLTSDQHTTAEPGKAR